MISSSKTNTKKTLYLLKLDDGVITAVCGEVRSAVKEKFRKTWDEINSILISKNK